MRPKAMDVFNQTVAVKDIQSLNGFIRDHMLEARPWRDRIDGLLTHFDQLNQAHQALVRARQQIELLEPIETAAKNLEAVAAESALFQQQIDAMDSYFKSRMVEAVRREVEAGQRDAGSIAAQLPEMDREIAALDETLRHLKNEIETAGGQRMQQLPLQLEYQRTQLRDKQRERRRLIGWLKQAGLPVEDLDRTAFQLLGQMLQRRQLELADESTRTAERRMAIARSLADVRRLQENAREELEQLESQSGNLPAGLAEVRRRLAENLGIEPSRLPFPCELITVAGDHQRWQPAVEMLLREFATTLLVPRRLLDAVRRQVDALVPDGRTRDGFVLRYQAVPEAALAPSGGAGAGDPPPAVSLEALTGRPLPPHSLLRAIRIRDGHRASQWLAEELRRRYDVVCCETIDELVAAPAPAVTARRHAKLHGLSYLKDDSPAVCDPRFFVLGWDSAPRIEQLRRRLDDLETRERALLGDVVDLEKASRQISRQLAAIEQAAQYDDYELIDSERHEREVEQLEAERKAIESSNDSVRNLRRRLEESQRRRQEMQAERDAAISRISMLRGRTERSEVILQRAEQVLADRREDGQLQIHQSVFAHLDATIGPRLKDCRDPADIMQMQTEVAREYQQSLEGLHRQAEPLREGIVRNMQRFLSEHPHHADDLRAGVEYLSGFLGLLQHLREEGLPRYERRFQVRLNEKTVQELGVFHGALQCESQVILDRIAMLNASLAELEYRPGTFMRLDPRPARDREIQNFQAALRECLTHAFDDDAQQNEDRFLLVQKLVQRLREDDRWRDKVTDVRQWFDFAAREIEARSGEEISCYEDSAGQSGGEKAKLAFTILVAAIAYQFDLDPMAHDDDRFRFVVVDEMFSKVDDRHAEYAMQLFEKFGLQLLIVAPLDAKARITESYVSTFLHAVKDERTRKSEIIALSPVEYAHAVPGEEPAGRRGRSRSVGLKPK